MAAFTHAQSFERDRVEDDATKQAPSKRVLAASAHTPLPMTMNSFVTRFSARKPITELHKGRAVDGGDDDFSEVGLGITRGVPSFTIPNVPDVSHTDVGLRMSTVADVPTAHRILEAAHR
jgi:hypothetical protein